ncbi:MAG TPA: FAD-dependent oxidoreductase [bacterium]|nr:FAD-dependent oxidoreductase [bacterium]HNS48714.1 FAD-dependent oxidoreductase [bacterium]
MNRRDFIKFSSVSLPGALLLSALKPHPGMAADASPERTEIAFGAPGKPTASYIMEPRRRLPVAAETDVLVIGGGPAGFPAAIAAARGGARTMLVERHPCLGGNLTAGSVINIRTYNDQAGRLIIQGIPLEFARRLKEMGGTASDPVKEPYVRQEPEASKYLIQEMALEAGVELRLYSLAVDVIKKGNQLRGVVLESKSGRQAVLAKAVIDATGDGDIAASAGAPYEKGWPGNEQLLQPLTLAFVIANISQYLRDHWAEEYPKLNAIMKRAYQNGAYPVKRQPGGLFPMAGRRELYANATRMAGDTTDVQDLTRAEIEGRRQAWALMKFYRDNLPGFEETYLRYTASQAGPRESRRILGDYVLNREDVLEGRDFPDGVARGAYTIDIHNPKDGTTQYLRLPPGTSYAIPYRCLVPQRVENLLVAGRCISVNHEALGSIRVMATCMATGQAAGTAAALAVQAGTTPRRLPVVRIQKRLQADGAVI